ncbi:DMT family transporter [Sphingomonas sanxanigenens]|uniref:EamA domain-containing protein n=1 Tax=Sphingomonas sanxanigenens DSM 19645 = NX02 TaxID=1123269 RepID=W0AAJ9_9SPHN|nr:DMT family transporter [Sphingomonas sanxanigenens]AHE53353.1 hypothetical protein NX02_08145 [Sphingomonas sanxanigenens DSM 19645 = NX02]
MSGSDGYGAGERRLYAIGLRLLATLCLASMSAMVKLTGDRGVSLPEAMFYRQFFALPVVVGAIMLGPGLGTIRTQRFGAHLSRAVLGLIGMSATFGAVLLLPLAEATTIGFTVPIFATVLSVLLLKEHAGIHRWGAVLLGFIGVLVVVQPGQSHIPMVGALVALASAFMISLISVLLRQIGKTESALTTVFWFSFLSVLPLGMLLPFTGRWHDGGTWALLLAMGTLGGMGQIALTASLRWAPVSLVVPFDYINLLWATVFGWLVFGMLPVESTWWGAPLIIASGLYIVWREHRRNREVTEAAAAVE